MSARKTSDSVWEAFIETLKRYAFASSRGLAVRSFGCSALLFAKPQAVQIVISDPLSRVALVPQINMRKVKLTV